MVMVVGGTPRHVSDIFLVLPPHQLGRGNECECRVPGERVEPIAELQYRQG